MNRPTLFAALLVLAVGTSAAGELQLLEGPTAAEDLVRVPGTRWLIGSGLAEPTVPGRLHLIDSARKQWQQAFPSAAVRTAPDARRFPDCTTPPDAAAFSAHGLALRQTGRGRHSLLVVNHGREAIEFFTVASSGATPQLTWVGCVAMPADVYLNSVAALPDGGFVTTQFYAKSQGGMGAIRTGALTGGVLEWHPGGVVTPIPGTELSGANGIETTDSGRVLYVAAWGGREIVRFDRRGATMKKDVAKVDFAPDNLRWAADGRTLLATGQRFDASGSGPLQMAGWRVVRVTPATLAVAPVYSADASAPLQGVSVGLEVDGQLWVGPFRGDRIGYLTLPR